MSKKRICFIAQFPPPIHGLSKAVDTLYNSELKNEFGFEKVDITNNKMFLRNLYTIWKSKAELVYFTISQTKGGNIRDLLLLSLLKMRRKKCIVHLHGGYYRKLVDHDVGKLQSRLNYYAINSLENVIVLSDSMKSIFTGMITEDRILVVPNCIDNDLLMTELEFEQKIRLVEDKQSLDVLYLSNFIKTKGYLEVLELAKIEQKRIDSGEKRKFHFHFAGKFFRSEEREFFLEFIDDNGLSNVITYHGEVKGTQKKELLKMCDIFTLITRYPNEGQPISIIEAMGNGMTIVTTNHAGIPDLVKNGENGIVVTETEQQKLSELYNRLYCNQETMINNRTVILETFKESIYINNFRSIFNRKLNHEHRN
ncbi:glycosyltransferase family 4 protein [Paenibacillus sp. OV219]|uniref:glycosyltransferase family 4 protein n=1 Tax=Paenibacillus sp. OV219 TaxID=1884377 RepID=UPI0008CC0192|nr:glycosyltransferase family 4 protein [Paenibacillus sp. OV219]SEN61420.1 Glycosyltransferase involved in cell wall bisynthesis [Paenibacillus sp. OV219]